MIIFDKKGNDFVNSSISPAAEDFKQSWQKKRKQWKTTAEVQDAKMSLEALARKMKRSQQATAEQQQKLKIKKVGCAKTR
jgi:signal transduction histidine kinase